MICRQGTNCWCQTRSDKVAFLIDGADYFEAFAQAARQAKQTIHIVGWDIDSRLILDRRDRLAEAVPPLGAFLNRLAEENRSLHIYILAWDFPLMYLQERQWLPQIRLGWKTHRRVHFELDSEHPIGGSQHEKFVVIDDRIAFCGGLDLTKNRWDTPDHRPDDPRRKTPDGSRYDPFHDVQMVVDGETARSLGMRFRNRWQRAVGQALPIPREEAGAQWPSDLPAHIDTPCDIAIARTLPAYKNHSAVHETIQLYTDAIRAAEAIIYIENQYLTVEKICTELGRRLAEEKGPEVVMILPDKASGWLEQSTMDAIRRHRLQRLVQQDRHNRLGVYYPVVGEKQTPVYVHSKVMVVDNRIAIVGSANLSNRSMGLDSECVLAVESRNQESIGNAVTHFRRRLLAEHLGTTPETLADAERNADALIQVLDSWKSSDRRLLPLDVNAEPAMDGTTLLPDESYLDPEEPLVLDRVLDHFTDDAESRNGGLSPLWKIAILVGVLLAMTAVWRWTPLSQWVTVDRLAQWAGMVDAVPLLFIIVIAGFVVGGLIFIPVTLMVGATALILPPWQSFACAMTGTVLNATATYLLGRYMGKQTVQKLAGERLERLNRYLARQGIVTMMIVRNLPVAPFSVVNIVAGTTGIRLPHYLLGTAIGMLPGIMAITIFTDRIREVIKNPSWTNIAVAAVIVMLLAAGMWWLRRRLRRKAPAASG